MRACARYNHGRHFRFSDYVTPRPRDRPTSPTRPPYTIADARTHAQTKPVGNKRRRYGIK